MGFLKAEKKIHILVHLSLIAGIFIVLVLLFFYVYLPITTNHGETIKVPELKGKTVTELEQYLDNYDLRFQINDSSYVPGAKPHSVLTRP